MELPPPNSLWIDTAPAPDRRVTGVPSRAEVVVVGGGIVGLTTAYRLAAAGRDVLLLEAATLASGVSGNTTAKVSAQHDMKYDLLTRRKGAAAARTYASTQTAAIEWIAERQETLGISCDFERRAAFLYSTEKSMQAKLRREADAASQAGLAASFETEIAGLPMQITGAVRFGDQAQFHPRRWLLGLADQVEALGGLVAEGVRVTGLSTRGSLSVDTTLGEVAAEHVIVATHYPIFDRGGFFARLEPVRDLAVSGLIDPTTVPTDMCLNVDDHHSFRTAPHTASGETHLVVIGEPYRTGQRTDVVAKHQALAKWCHSELGLQTVTHSWSAHDLSTPDQVPYIGRYHPKAHNVWVATGFGQWGMSGGTVAAMLLSDIITDQADPAVVELYDPNRGHLASAPKILKDNAVVAKHFGADHARSLADSTDLAHLPAGDAAVTRIGAALVAAYREPGGQLHTVSAHCTHLGCVVNFNNDERTWDCPCHASRFGVDGEVVQGPAVKPLSAVSVPGTPRADDNR